MINCTRLLVLLLLTASAFCGEQYKVTDLVYLDIAIRGEHAGRVVIGLFGETVPRTAKNFKVLATTGIRGKKYSNSSFHRVVRNFMIQGGDVVSGDGLGAISIYGKHFKDENFIAKHTAPGFVSMANSGPNTNGCQFFIITQPTAWLDGKHVVFGKVIEGLDIVQRIENLKTYTDDHPISSVNIIESGQLPLKEAFYVQDDANDVVAWVKASIVPLAMSFSILALFHYFYKKLDGATAGI